MVSQAFSGLAFAMSAEVFCFTSSDLIVQSPAGITACWIEDMEIVAFRFPDEVVQVDAMSPESVI